MQNISPFRIIALGVTIFIAVFSILVFSGKIPFIDNKSQNTSKFSGKVVIWGTLSKKRMDEYLSKFNSQTIGYTMEYTEVESDQFKYTLTQALSYNNGPDLIIATHDIILANEIYLNTLPYLEYSETKYKSTFVDAGQVFARPSGVIAFPVGIDTMVLFYNRELQNKLGIVEPPKDWNKMLSIAETHTSQSSTPGVFKVSILPFGSYKNYNYNKDVLMMLINQLGGETLTRRGGVYGVGIDARINGDQGPSYIDTATRYMASFSNPAVKSFTWSPRMSDALSAFVSGTLLYYPAYISERDTIKLVNTKLDFDYVSIPQVANKDSLYTASKVLGISMMASAHNPTAAKDAFVAFGSDKTFANSISSIAGEPSPRKDTLAGSDNGQYSEIIGRSILVAKPLYDIDNVYTSALVDNMLQSIISNRKDISDAVDTFVLSLKKLYNISTY